MHILEILRSEPSSRNSSIQVQFRRFFKYSCYSVFDFKRTFNIFSATHSIRECKIKHINKIKKICNTVNSFKRTIFIFKSVKQKRSMKTGTIKTGLISMHPTKFSIIFFPWKHDHFGTQTLSMRPTFFVCCDFCRHIFKHTVFEREVLKRIHKEGFRCSRKELRKYLWRLIDCFVSRYSRLLHYCAAHGPKGRVAVYTNKIQH